MINVTKTYLPPIEEYIEYLKKIWDSGWITNHGPFVEELEAKLKEYFGVKHLFLVSNGTLALQIAIKALGLSKEIITTPFSYVATTASIVWEGCKPVFLDINAETLNIDADKLEEAIADNTEAILATHVFGNPCDVKKIREIANRHGLKVIYDAAHSFGVKYDDQALVSFGDLSIISFHATKIFHTIEGGAIITNDDDLAEKIFRMRNFGHVSKDLSETFSGVGINGKMSELHAAMGLCMFSKIKSIVAGRKIVSQKYDELLLDSLVKKQKIVDSTLYNYSYYPVVFPSEKQLLQVMAELRQNDIYPRRYFKPSLNTLDYIDYVIMPISENVTNRIICLPLYPELEDSSIELIAEVIKKYV